MSAASRRMTRAVQRAMMLVPRPPYEVHEARSGARYVVMCEGVEPRPRGRKNPHRARFTGGRHA
jgi:hypothetical protein